VLYCGYRLDAETGLYHVRHRTYHPTLGRWNQRDPIGYEGGPSLYAYVGSQPLSTQDPSGLIDPDIAMPSYKSPRQQLEEDLAFEERQRRLRQRDQVEDFIDCEHLTQAERDMINARVKEACRILRKCHRCLDDCCCVPEEERNAPYYDVLYGPKNTRIKGIVEGAIECTCDIGVDIEVESEDEGGVSAYTYANWVGRFANIHLRPLWFRRSPPRQVEDLVHEMTHYGGSTDPPAPDWQNAHYLDNALPWLARVATC
jgi:RHS repeat-associated protein